MSDDKHTAFERAQRDTPKSIVGEFWDFLKHNKKYYLIPIVIVLLLMAVLVMLGGTAAAPFIYRLF